VLICNFGIQLIYIEHFNKKLMTDIFSWGCDVIIWGSAKCDRGREGQARIQEFLVEGDDMDEEKICRGLGAAIGPQRGPGAAPLVGVKGAKLPMKVTLFSRFIQWFCTF
jgi:hypothetical protein